MFLTLNLKWILDHSDAPFFPKIRSLPEDFLLKVFGEPILDHCIEIIQFHEITVRALTSETTVSQRTSKKEYRRKERKVKENQSAPGERYLYEVTGESEEIQAAQSRLVISILPHGGLPQIDPIEPDP